MDAIKPITPTIAIAGQPTEDDLRSLKRDGYVGVVNLRHDGEPDQPIGTAAEGELVRGLGMDYLHRGFGGAPFAPEAVDAVCDFLSSHPGDKVLVHCRSGGRAAALVLLHYARARNWPASEAIAEGKAMGLDVQGGLRMLVEQALNQ